MNNRERTLRALVASAGLHLDALSVTGSSHYRAAVSAPDGRKTVLFFPGSGSDWRGDRNRLADLRRFARGSRQKASA